MAENPGSHALRPSRGDTVLSQRWLPAWPRRLRTRSAKRDAYLLRPAQRKFALYFPLSISPASSLRRCDRGHAKQRMNNILREIPALGQSHAIGKGAMAFPSNIFTTFFMEGPFLVRRSRRICSHAQQKRANRFQSAGSVPTRKIRFPSAAGTAEPVTGTSTKRTWRRAATAAIFFRPKD